MLYLTPVKMQTLVSLMTPNETQSFQEIVKKYCELKHRIDHSEKESWHFRKAMDFNVRVLGSLEYEYVELMNKINSHTLDELRAQVEKAEQDFESYIGGCSKKYGIIFSITTSSMKSKIRVLKMLFETKKNYGTLSPFAEIAAYYE